MCCDFLRIKPSGSLVADIVGIEVDCFGCLCRRLAGGRNWIEMHIELGGFQRGCIAACPPISDHNLIALCAGVHQKYLYVAARRPQETSRVVCMNCEMEGKTI